MTSLHDPVVPRWLAARTHASAAEIANFCRMTTAEVRARLAVLERRRLIAGCTDPDAPHLTLHCPNKSGEITEAGVLNACDDAEDAATPAMTSSAAQGRSSR